MPIVFHPQSRTFHLYNPSVSYIFKVLPSGHMGQLYCGKALQDRPDFDRLFETAPRSMSVCYFDGDDAYSLEHIKQEYPTCGAGDMHLPALDAQMPDGSRLLDLRYQGHAIAPGKPPIEGLPATYAEQDTTRWPASRSSCSIPSSSSCPPWRGTPRSPAPDRDQSGWTGL